MAFEAHSCICFAHATAIIYHLQKGFAGIYNDQFNFGGTRIHRILQQLFYRTGRALNHLTSRNLVSNIIG